jgi:hypothetical protein
MCAESRLDKMATGGCLAANILMGRVACSRGDKVTVPGTFPPVLRLLIWSDQHSGPRRSGSESASDLFDK